VSTIHKAVYAFANVTIASIALLVIAFFTVSMRTARSHFVIYATHTVELTASVTTRMFTVIAGVMSTDQALVFTALTSSMSARQNIVVIALTKVSAASITYDMRTFLASVMSAVHNAMIADFTGVMSTFHNAVFTAVAGVVSAAQTVVIAFAARSTAVWTRSLIFFTNFVIAYTNIISTRSANVMFTAFACIVSATILFVFALFAGIMSATERVMIVSVLTSTSIVLTTI
jgi:hypothetical protein